MVLTLFLFLNKIVTGDSDGIVRVYDEQTRQLKVVYEGGGTGAAGHKMKVNCVKWVDENLIVSGGWDKTIKVWDIREPAPIRSIFGPYVAADSFDPSIPRCPRRCHPSWFQRD